MQSSIGVRGWVNNRRRDELLALLALSGSEMGMSIIREGNTFQSISSKNTICFTQRVLFFGDEKDPAGTLRHVPPLGEDHG